MTSYSAQHTIAAAFFVLALLGIEANVTVHSQNSEVALTGVFPAPLVDGGALKTGTSAPIHASLKISNVSGSALRFGTYRSVLPELVNASGTVVPFDYGANRYRVPRESDYPLLLPGQSLVISLDATVTLQDGELDWQGSDGLLGFWKITRSAAPYRFRLSPSAKDRGLARGTVRRLERVVDQ
jgi:hypothetical protein